MTKRIAAFAEKEEVETYFEFKTDEEAIFSPHYNLAVGQHIPVLLSDGKAKYLERARWGLDSSGTTTEKSMIDPEDAVMGINEKRFEPCIVPVSGFFKWKSSGKRANNPFFIRMLHQPLLALAGVSAIEKVQGKKDLRSFAIINVEANALLQPLDPMMPLILSRELSLSWIEKDKPFDQLIQDGKKLFLLTDMTVLRVSNKVNDLSQNSPKLIQPLPK